MTLNRFLLYAKDVALTVRFYERYFGFAAARDAGDRIVELIHPKGGTRLMIHQAAKGQRQGQVLVKLVFDVEDVQSFCDKCRADGLEFGEVHMADGYVFANAKDPCLNPISVSSRAFRVRA